jgi:hypothetical protein
MNWLKLMWSKIFSSKEQIVPVVKEDPVLVTPVVPKPKRVRKKKEIVNGINIKTQ